MTLRALVGVALALASSAGAAAAPMASPECAAASAWPHWSRYVQAFLSGDGRVIDRTAQDRTTSEGQAYALFFSVVANDPALFARIVRWTEDNLAGSDLAHRLPAWAWGKRRDGSWGVLDANSAADADVWMAYALLEAGRLWSEPRYAALGRSVLSNVAAREVANLPALGPTLLPGASGFAVEDGRAWRLNPSYVPPLLLYRAAAAQPEGPWREVLASSIRMVRESAPRGVVADWVLYRANRGFAADPIKGSIGSYDAIRVYLWVGMLSPADPVRRSLEHQTAGMLRLLEQRGTLPEKVDAASLEGRGQAPVGFYAALLPLAASRDANAVPRLDARLKAALKDGLYGSPPAYYDQNLILFARGFAEGKFGFGAAGRLEPSWERACGAR
jgi:endoglucanase